MLSSLFKLILLRLLIVFTPAPVCGYYSSPSLESEWTHELTLESDVLVKWVANDNYFLTMEMSAPTNGYVGIGFSPNGDMTGSDIVIAWVDSQGMPHLKDYHAVEKGTPIEDLQQDYELIAAEEKDNRTTVRFRRRWETCDEKHDMKIGNDTMRLIWAWHQDDPEMTSGSSIQFKWHGASNRGVKSVYLRNPPRPKRFPDELEEQDPRVKNWDLVMNNIHVSNKPTTYMCKVVKFPKVKSKHHMIGFHPLISEGNRENVHHMSVYHCQIPEHLGETKGVFDQYLNREPAECYGNSMPAELVKHCFTFLFTWAVGSEGEMFPAHVGSPLGESEESSYFKLEIHYDNPSRRSFLDSSGLRVFYTDEIRPYDGTTLFVGHRTTPFQMIPYGQEKFNTYGFCSRECTENGINLSTGLRAISVMLHAHLSGRKIKLRHIRQGKELPPIAEDNHYDFNYQQFRILSNEVVIMPGDELLVECEYDTLERDRFVFGGEDSEQEMCNAVLFYYPRSNLTDCRSQPEFYSFFKTLGIENVTGAILEKMKLPYDGNSMTPDSSGLIPPDNAYQLLGSENEGGSLENPFDLVRITKPENLKNYSVGEHMRQMRWNEKSLVRRVEKGWRNGLHYTFCAAPAQRRIYTRNHVHNYPKFREYKDGTKSSCRGRKREKISSYQGDRAQDDHDHDHDELSDAEGKGHHLKASSHFITFCLTLLFPVSIVYFRPTQF